MQQSNAPLNTKASSSLSASAPACSRLFPNLVPDVIPLVLATTIGARMFPLTSSPSNPKHALPVGGTSLLERILIILVQSNFAECLVAVALEDAVTLQTILQPHAIATTATSPHPPPLPTLTPPPSALQDDVAETSTTIKSPSFPVLELDLKGTKQPANDNITFNRRLRVTLIPVPEDCGGSAEAVRWIEQQQRQQQQEQRNFRMFLPLSSHLLIIPGDLVLLDPTLLRKTVDEHLQQHVLANNSNASKGQPDVALIPPAPACTMVLINVGEQDEHGIPLKESAKQKKGGFAREDDNIEYIALWRFQNPSGPRPAITTPSGRVPPPRVIWKESKADVEEDEDQVGSTPKLVLPKPRLRLHSSGGSVQVRTDWNDVHIYLLAPWVRCLIQKRTSLSSLHDHLIPLLISRQFQGIRATFQQQQQQQKSHGGRTEHVFEEDPELLEQLVRFAPAQRGSAFITHSSSTTNKSPLEPSILTRRGDDDQTTFPSSGSSGHSRNMDDNHSNANGNLRRGHVATWLSRPYAVSAVLGESSRPAALRACTIAWYLYANRELVLHHIAATLNKSLATAVTFPEQTTVHAKFQSIVLPKTSMGDKVTFKSVTIGRNCKIGSKCKLNNVVVMDDVVLGDNCLLQNCIVGTASKLGDNCHLNDCQVAPHTVIASGTKEKGEAFSSDDQYDDEHDTDGAAFLTSEGIDMEMSL